MLSIHLAVDAFSNETKKHYEKWKCLLIRRFPRNKRFFSFFEPQTFNRLATRVLEDP